MHHTIMPLGIDQAQRVCIGNVFVMIGRIDLAGNQELSLAEGIGMRVKGPLAAILVVRVLAVLGQETPARKRPAGDEDLRGDIDHRVSCIPLDVARFVRVGTADLAARAEVDQQDRSQAAALRIVAGAHANKAMIAAGKRLRIHADGRVVVGQAVEFLGPGPVGIHGPDALGDPSALVDILPAVIHDPAVIENHRTEFADGAVGKLFDVAAVGVHAVQAGGHEPPLQRIVCSPRVEEKMILPSGR